MTLSCQSPLSHQLCPRERCHPLAVRCPVAAEAVPWPAEGKHFHRSLTAQRLCFPSSTGLTETPAQRGGPCPLREVPGCCSSCLAPGRAHTHSAATLLQTHTQPLRTFLCLSESDQQHLGASQPAWPSGPLQPSLGCVPAPVMLMDTELCPSPALSPWPCLAIPCCGPPRCPSPNPK